MSEDNSEKHLALMFKIASVSNEAGSVQYFIQRCLETIATDGDWSIAQMWQVDADADVVTCAPSWYASISASEFRSASLERRFSQGVGLPGRVWALSAAMGVDLEKEKGLNFPRHDSSHQYGLRSAFAFPIRNGLIVSGVCEFFSQQEKHVDDKSCRFFEKLGSYLGTLISEKMAIERLISSETINGAILDQAHNAFISMDARGIVVMWNRRAEAIFGWTKEEAIGRLLVELIIPERYRNAHVTGMFRYLATGDAKVIDKLIKTPALNKSGVEIPIELSIFAIKVPEKQQFGAFIKDMCHGDKAPDIVLE